MDSLDVRDIATGGTIESVAIPENIRKYLDYKKAAALLHEVVVAHQANQRQGTHATKTRAEVRGGGRKPWRQKHTGRARQGSIRSPLFRKGGGVFGPKPRDYYQALPANKKRTAKYVALAQRVKNGDMLVVNRLGVEQPKTREFARILSTLSLNGKRILLVAQTFDENIRRASRNISRAGLARVADLNAYDIMNCVKLVITKEALQCL